MMKQPVEECRGKNLIPAEQMSPPSKAGIGSQDDRAMLIAGGDQPKEMMSLLLREPGIAHFVDQKSNWARYSVGGVGASGRDARRSDIGLRKVSQRRKQHGIALHERPVGQRQAQMGFPCSGRTKEHEIGAGSHK